MDQIPSYVDSFRKALIDENVARLQLDLCTPPVQGYHGILTTSHIQYNQDNLLGRSQEFTFELTNQRVELSLQLYRNVRDHWRLFCYTTTGMLFSINLSLLQRKGPQSPILTLSQTLRLTMRGISPEERRDRTDQLCAALNRLGLEVDGQTLALGTFDADKGDFLDTTARAFLRDFTLTSLVKGHFMGNKGYELPKLPKFEHAILPVVRDATSARRLIPLRLRYEVLEKAGGRCVLCGRTPRDGIKLHVDHIKPYSQGGRSELVNLQALCHECNIGKGNRAETRFS